MSYYATSWSQVRGDDLIVVHHTHGLMFGTRIYFCIGIYIEKCLYKIEKSLIAYLRHANDKCL